jgi:hypothetical protein
MNGSRLSLAKTCTDLKNVLGPSHEVEDEHHEQDDDEKTDQPVAGSGDGKHVVTSLVIDAKKK